MLNCSGIAAVASTRGFDKRAARRSVRRKFRMLHRRPASTNSTEFLRQQAPQRDGFCSGGTQGYGFCGGGGLTPFYCVGQEFCGFCSRRQIAAYMFCGVVGYCAANLRGNLCGARNFAA